MVSSQPAMRALEVDQEVLAAASKQKHDNILLVQQTRPLFSNMPQSPVDPHMASLVICARHLTTGVGHHAYR